MKFHFYGVPEEVANDGLFGSYNGQILGEFMDLTLKPELERFVDELVQTGRFASRADVIEAGLVRLLVDPDPEGLDADTQAAIDRGEQQVASGQYRDWSEVSTELRRAYLGK